MPGPTAIIWRLDRLIERSPYGLVAILAWLLIVVKAGVGFITPTVSTLASWPAPQDGLTGTSYALRLVAWFTRQETNDGYLVIAGLLTVLAIITITLSLRSAMAPRAARAGVLLVATGSIGGVLLGNIGRNDAAVILGGALLGILGRHLAWALAGTSLMLLGNPEQALVATVAYTLVCAAPALRANLRSAFACAAFAFATTALMFFWSRSVGIAGRLGYLDDYLGNSIYHFGRNAPLSLYAAYGVIWILMIFGLLHMRNAWPLGAIGLIALPLLVTAITLDQTRVFVGVTAAATCAVVTAYGGLFVSTLDAKRLPTLTLVLAACIRSRPVEWCNSGPAS